MWAAHDWVSGSLDSCCSAAVGHSGGCLRMPLQLVRLQGAHYVRAATEVPAEGNGIDDRLCGPLAAVKQYRMGSIAEERHGGFLPV